MRTTIIIQDELLREARQLSGLKRKTDIVHAGLRMLIERLAAEQLAGLHGKAKDFYVAPRRRTIRSKAKAA